MSNRNYMRYSLFILSFILLSNSCTQNATSEKGPAEKQVRKESSQSQIKVDESIEVSKPDSISQEFHKLFSKVLVTFPNDSASLNRFFSKNFQPNSEEKIQRLNARLARFLEEGFMAQYTEVNNELKPLMTFVVQADTISKPQIEKMVYLYSFYDASRGSAMFSNLINIDENYSLTWESFRIIASYTKDTSSISGLIELDNAIRTNAELGQAMQGFLNQAILNNPEGYLEMYSQRSEEEKVYFAEYCKMWDTPVEEIIAIFKDIANNSTNPTHRSLAKNLLVNITE